MSTLFSSIQGVRLASSIPRRTCLLLRGLVLSLVLAACGGGQTSAVSAPFTANDARYFEDGVDYVDDPTEMGGSWREDWSRELDQRVQLADLVMYVDIVAIRTDSDPEGNETLNLLATNGGSLYGQPPAADIEFSVSQVGAGYGTVAGNEQRLLNQRFLAFIKWYQNEDGDVLPHWHLAPATDEILERTEYLIERRRSVRTGGRTRTVIQPVD